MDTWETLSSLADRVAALGQQLINEHKPGATLDESNPKYREMMKLYKQTQEVCEADFRKTISDAEALKSRIDAEVARIDAENNARLVAAGLEDMVPPEEVEKIKASNAAAAAAAVPLLALPFADEHEPPPADVEELIPRLLQLPKLHLGASH